MGKYRYIGQHIVTRKDLRKVIIEKISKDSIHYFISYFLTHNRLVYDIITEADILSEEEYDKIKFRVNKINNLFDGLDL